MGIIKTASVVAVLLLPAVAFAADAKKPAPKDKTITMKGEVLDSTCYFTKGAHGADHKDCAQSCLKSGGTASFLSNGKVYLLLADHENGAVLDQAKEKAGDTVTITGTELDKNGVKAILLSSVK